MTDHSLPRVFHTDLDGAYSEVAITLDDPPTFAFVRSPFNFTRPLPRDELRDLAAGHFGPDLDAQLRACTLPPTPPLSDGDRARIVRLARDAWATAATPTPISNEATLGDEQTSDTLTALPTTMTVPDSVVATSVAIVSPNTAADPASRRVLKVLLTIQPEGGAGYRALVGVGATGCDPHFATIEAAGALAAILHAVPAIIAAAETHWRVAPRYPTAPRPTVPATAVSAKAPARPKAGVTQATGVRGVGIDAALTGAATPVTTDGPPAKPAATTQISLFG